MGIVFLPMRNSNESTKGTAVRKSYKFIRMFSDITLLHTLGTLANNYRNNNDFAKMAITEHYDSFIFQNL